MSLIHFPHYLSRGSSLQNWSPRSTHGREADSKKEEKIIAISNDIPQAMALTNSDE